MNRKLEGIRKSLLKFRVAEKKKQDQEAKIGKEESTTEEAGKLSSTDASLIKKRALEDDSADEVSDIEHKLILKDASILFEPKIEIDFQK